MQKLERKNYGLAEIDLYRDCPLPEDFEIVELLGDVIMVEMIDVASDGKSVMRGKIVLPQGVADHRAWRVGKVLLTGPETRQVKKGDLIMFPGDKGLPGISRNGKAVHFLNEERIFGICKKVTEGCD